MKSIVFHYPLEDLINIQCVNPRSEGDVVIKRHREKIGSLGEEPDFLSQVDVICFAAVDVQSIDKDETFAQYIGNLPQTMLPGICQGAGPDC